MNFAFFTEGMEVGCKRIDTAPLAEAWDRLYPPAGPQLHMPAALIVSILMRGYTMILDRRLPGNVHAGQNMVWGAPAHRGEPLMVGLTCIEKQLRNDRAWIGFAAIVESIDGTRHLDARMRFLWAG